MTIKKHWIAAGLIVLLCLLGATWLWPFSGERFVESGDNRALSAAANAKPVSAGRQSTDDHPAEVSGAATVEDHHHDQVPPPAPRYARVIVEFRLGDGSPLVDFGFTYALESGVFPFSGDSRPEPRRYGVPPAFSNRGRTGADGRFEVPAALLRILKGPRDWLHLAHEDTALPFPAPDDASIDVHAQEALIALQGSVEVYSLTLRRNKSAGFMLVYEDGTPYTSKFGGSLHSKVERPQFLYKTPSASGEFTIGIPEGFSHLSLSVHGERRGFAVNNEFVRTPEQIRPYERLTIPRDEKQAILRVDLSRWTAGEEVKIALGSWTGLAPMPYNAKAGEIWETFSLTAAESGLPYYLVVTGPSGLWRSELFWLKFNDTLTLTPLPAKPAVIRARIVDENGSPLTPAVLNLALWRYANWFFDGKPEATRNGGKNSGGERVCADREGRCELGGVMPGRVKLTVEAWRCEVVTREIEAKPGQTVDLGDIVCKPAAGAVVIRLKNRKPNMDYYVWVWTPRPCSAYMTIVHDKPGDIRIDGLPLRGYMVSVEAGNGGGSVMIEKVELTADSPAFEIEVEVGDLIPANNPVVPGSGK